MSKLFSLNSLALLVLAFPAVTLADVSGTPTLAAVSTLNLDTGTTGSSGGDILWTGSSITLQGSAKAFDLGSSTPFSSVTKSILSTLGAALTAAPITPVVNDVIAVKTNGGNFGKILVTAISGTSITLQFTTFTGSTTSGGPAINAIINNYSGVLPGLPNYGIAPASIFVLYGSGMSDNVPLVFQSSIAPGLPLTLNHTSISVTVNGKTVTPALYYAIPTQVAAVLPSTTPAGSGTLTLTYNGQASAPVPIHVSASAFGIASLNGTGAGGVLATDANFHLILPTASAAPGQTIVLWGSGLGADTNNNDRTFPNQQDDLKNATVYIGGVRANVAFAGRSQFPGVDQINVVVPNLGDALASSALQAHDVPHAASAGFQGGCAVSVAVVVAGVTSNFTTLPVNPGNGVCVDALYGINGTQLTQSGNQGTVRSGFVSLIHATEPNSELPALKPQAQTFKTIDEATAFFNSTTGSSFVGGSSFLSLGSCIVLISAGGGGGAGQSTGLDAGASIALAGGGISAQLNKLPTIAGDYVAQLSNPLTGGSSYTFTGPGGNDVGPFSVTVNYPAPLTWTNESSITTVTKASGQLITWTGGAPGTYLAINGDSSSADGSAFASFTCLTPIDNEQFTVPAYVLGVLPAGNGSLGIFNSTNPVSFTARGLDFGTASAGFISTENVTYQ